MALRRSPLERGDKQLERRTPLARGDSELKRRVPIRKVNRRRKAVLFEDQFGDVARVRWFQMQECCNCGAWPSVCAHVKSRAAGGTAADIIPLCVECHQRQHDMGWDALNIADPPARAADYDARYRRVAP